MTTTNRLRELATKSLRQCPERTRPSAVPDGLTCPVCGGDDWRHPTADVQPRQHVVNDVRHLLGIQDEHDVGAVLRKCRNALTDDEYVALVAQLAVATRVASDLSGGTFCVHCRGTGWVLWDRWDIRICNGCGWLGMFTDADPTANRTRFGVPKRG